MENTEKTKFFDRLKETFDLHPELDVDAAMAGIKKNINFHGMNIWILPCAIVIASLGLNVNSTAVIIGAMLISPLMGPIIGMGMAVGINDLQLMRTAIKNLVKMVLISVAASALFFLLSPLNMQHPSELLARTNPTIFDVLIALVGGFAGALEICRKDKGTVISGVAIATALMPPLCTVGYGISNLDLNVAAGAFYLFFINCVFVALATFAVVKIVGFPQVRHFDSKVERRTRMLGWALMIVFVVPSIFSAVRMIQENNFNTKADQFVSSLGKTMSESVVYDYKTDTQTDPYSVTLFIAGKRLSESDKETIYSAAEKEYGIGRHQIVFEVALAMGEDSELQKQVYCDLSSSVEMLKEKLAQYQALEIPYEQIGAEVSALYPDVQEIKLARGQNEIFAVVKTSSDSLLSDNLAAWLKVRLQAESVSIIQK